MFFAASNYHSSNYHSLMQINQLSKMAESQPTSLNVHAKAIYCIFNITRKRHPYTQVTSIYSQWEVAVLGTQITLLIKLMLCFIFLHVVLAALRHQHLLTVRSISSWYTDNITYKTHVLFHLSLRCSCSPSQNL